MVSVFGNVERMPRSKTNIFRKYNFSLCYFQLAFHHLATDISGCDDVSGCWKCSTTGTLTFAED